MLTLLETPVVGPTAIIGLVIAIAVLIFLVLRTKVHALIALVVAASIAALSAGMAPDAAIKSITTGFGSTLSTIGLVVGFGVMMGAILEVSGAAERLALSMIRWLGKRKEEWALAGAGYIISIPIFVDSAFVILNPLVKALARAFRWKRMLESGEFATISEVAEREGIAPSYMTRVLRLTLLAPDILEAILDGTQGPEVTLARVLEPFPLEWEHQAMLFG